MTSQRTDKERIFTAALELADPAQRRAFLDAACGPDRQLLAEVEALLIHDEEAGSFIEEPAVAPGAAPQGTVDFRSVTEGPGTVIGPYKLLQKIGEGGFGVVYMAEQQHPVRRKVALKIIKPGMDTREVIARFESERQALALMDHPHIARVLDAGATESGRPYFVMELVKGVPITEYCDKNNLPTEKRLDLFLSVCHAVQHAHQKGIIHRDLKPSNVMVTLHDGKPVPKVIDFGVAKATSQQLTEKTLFTAYGQMIGTPVYMSPEQAEMSGLDIDTRSDIYSLGVLLYELLTGTTPFDSKRLRDAGYVEMQRIIREEEPPRPSTRVSTLGASLTVVSSQRSTDPGKLRQLLRGDLDLIVMKAMEKERTLRYETPNSFAQDVERFLNHEAVLARPHSTAYMLRKFAERNKAAVAWGAAIAAVLLLGTIVSSVLAVHATNQKNQAQANLIALHRQQAQTDEERKKAVSEAERAKKAEARAAEQQKLADERAIVAEKAQAAEALQHQAAEEKRKAIEEQKNQIEGLNNQLRRSMEDQRRSIYAAEMNLVRLEAQRGNLPRLRELLLQQIPGSDDEDLRGWEWTYWYRFLNRAQVIQRFEGFVYGQPDSALSIAPGGKLAALTRGDKTEWIELPSGKVVGSVPVRLRILVNRNSLSSTGRLVDAAAVAPTAYRPRTNEPPPPPNFAVWELNGERQTFAFPPETLKHLSFVTLSRDGKRVAALGNDVSHVRDKPMCRLLVWDVESGQIALNQAYPGELNRMELNGEGTLAIAWLCHGTARQTDEPREVAALIEVATGNVLGRARHNDDVDSAYLLPDGKHVLLSTLGFSGANLKELLLWTVGEEIPRKLTDELMPDYVKGAVSPDGTLFAASGHTVSTIRLFDTQRGTLVTTLHNEAATIESLTFSPDGKQLIAGSTTGEILRWNLDQDEDLFRLRAQPLGQLASSTSYALSPDRSHLALINLQRRLVLRTLRGDERAIGERDLAAAANAVESLHFSPDGRYLAYVTGNVVQCFDVAKGERLWRVEAGATSGTTAAALRSRPIQLLLFTPDSQQVLMSHFLESLILECATGKAPPSGPSLRRQVLALWTDNMGRVLSASSGRLTEKAQIVVSDVFSGEELGSMQISPPRGPTTFHGAADGRHAAVARPDNGVVEIWDFLDDRQVLTAAGDTIVLSSDGSLAAIATSAPLTITAIGGAGRDRARVLQEATLWDVASGRQLARISLAGNQADEMRFSPDGRRLVTLHGKQPSGSGGAIPEVRLWDVFSGREIMAIPVAEVNHYVWDVNYDPSGHRLTLLVLTKAAGTSGGWGSTVLDATPLSEDEDAQLVARRRVSDLLARNPLPAAAIESLQADNRLKPAAREAAIAILKRQRVDPNALATFCQEAIANAYATEEVQQSAFRCARALVELEPGTLRSRVLLGGAQFRTRRVEEAFTTLTAPPPDPGASPANSDPEQAYCRDVLLILVEHSLGKTTDAEKRASQLSSPTQFSSGETSLTTSWLYRLWMEARQAFPTRFGPTLAGSYVPSDETLRMMFGRMDANSDGGVDRPEAERTPISTAFAEADADAGGSVSVEEFVKIMRVLIERGTVRLRGPGSTRLPPDLDQQLRIAVEAHLHEPENPLYLNNRAWLTSTHPDEPLRNGKQAIVDATKACELTQWRQPMYIDTLAAAYAETGDFAAAMKYQQQALPLASDSSRAEMESRLALYREHKPYRLPGRYQSMAGWGRAVDPLGDCEVAATDGTLRIKIPGSLHNLSPRGYGTDAPRVLQAVDGDFTAEVQVTCPIQPLTSLPRASTAYHGAGLLVYADLTHFLRAERNGFFRDWDQDPSFGKTGRTGLSSNAPTIEYWSEGQIAAQRVDWSGTQPLLPGESTWLRIERRGRSMQVSLSHDGQKWEEAKTIETTFPPRVQVGVLAINSSADPFTAEFSQLKLTQP